MPRSSGSCPIDLNEVDELDMCKTIYFNKNLPEYTLEYIESCGRRFQGKSINYLHPNYFYAYILGSPLPSPLINFDYLCVKYHQTVLFSTEVIRYDHNIFVNPLFENKEIHFPYFIKDDLNYTLFNFVNKGTGVFNNPHPLDNYSLKCIFDVVPLFESVSEKEEFEVYLSENYNCLHRTNDIKINFSAIERFKNDVNWNDFEKQIKLGKYIVKLLSEWRNS